MTGDTKAEGLGLPPVERQFLIDRVSIIFHVAASVRFDDPLRDAIFINTRSTRDVCILAASMKKLVVSFLFLCPPFFFFNCFPDRVSWVVRYALDSFFYESGFVGKLPWLFECYCCGRITFYLRGLCFFKVALFLSIFSSFETLCSVLVSMSRII